MYVDHGLHLSLINHVVQVLQAASWQMQRLTVATLVMHSRAFFIDIMDINPTSTSLILHSQRAFIFLDNGNGLHSHSTAFIIQYQLYVFFLMNRSL